MNILVVAQHYKPEPFRLPDICEALAERGHQVTVVTGVPNYPMGQIYPGYEKSAGTEEVINGVRIRRCFTIPRKKGILFRLLNYYSFMLSSTRYLSHLEEEYDVVFSHQTSPVMMARGGAAYAKKHNKPFVLYCLDLWPESLTIGGVRHGSLIYRHYLRVSRKIYGAADELLISSRAFAPYFRTVLCVRKKLRYLPQYAEQLYDVVPEWAFHEPPYHFMFAGNIGRAQGVDTILKAARLLQDDDRICFDIVGDGTELESCQAMAADLKNVTFHGRRPVEEMPQYFAGADAMLVTLKNEPVIACTLPGKVQSYMAAGRAVVGAVGGETAHVVFDAECGVCMEPESAQKLADAIRTLADQPELFAKYGCNAKQFYQKYFRKETFVEDLINILAKTRPM